MRADVLTYIPQVRSHLLGLALVLLAACLSKTATDAQLSQVPTRGLSVFDERLEATQCVVPLARDLVEVVARIGEPFRL